MSRRGWLLFIALCFIWGVPYLLIRVAVRELSPPGLILLRTGPAALLLLPFALREGGLGTVLAHWRWVLAYTAAEVAVPWLLLFHAEERLASSLAGLLVATVPLIGAVLYRLTGTEAALGARRVAGLLLGFAGVAALMGLDVGGGEVEGLAVLEMLGVALCYAVGPLVVARRLQGVPGYGVVTVSLAVTALAYLPAGLLTWPEQVSAQTAAATAVLAVACTAVAFVLFFALVREAGPSRTTVITYVNPLVAVLLGVLLLDEPLTAGMVVGTPLILAGSVLGTGRGGRPRAPSRD